MISSAVPLGYWANAYTLPAVHNATNEKVTDRQKQTHKGHEFCCISFQVLIFMAWKESDSQPTGEEKFMAIIKATAIKY